MENSLVLQDGKNLAIDITVANRAIQDSRNEIKNVLVKLDPALCKKTGVVLSKIAKMQMAGEAGAVHYNFYLLKIQLRQDKIASLLSFNLDFGPKGANEPIVEFFTPELNWSERIISATGEGNNFCLWQIERPDAVVELSVVFKVEKGRNGNDNPFEIKAAGTFFNKGWLPFSSAKPIKNFEFSISNENVEL